MTDLELNYLECTYLDETICTETICDTQTSANCSLKSPVKNDGLAKKIIILALLFDMQTMFAKCCCTTYAETNKSAMLYSN